MGAAHHTSFYIDELNVLKKYQMYFLQQIIFFTIPTGLFVENRKIRPHLPLNQ
jgi:hypothetical protein